jgi:hypothetical protein
MKVRRPNGTIEIVVANSRKPGGRAVHSEVRLRNWLNENCRGCVVETLFSERSICSDCDKFVPDMLAGNGQSSTHWLFKQKAENPGFGPAWSGKGEIVTKALKPFYESEEIVEISSYTVAL